MDYPSISKFCAVHSYIYVLFIDSVSTVSPLMLFLPPEFSSFLVYYPSNLPALDLVTLPCAVLTLLSFLYHGTSH